MEVIKNFEIHDSRDIAKALELLDTAFAFRPHYYAENYVFDEDKSVRWNREEVLRRNKEAKDALKSAREMKAESSALLNLAIIKYIMDESVVGYHFTELDAKLILEAASTHHEDNWWEWLDEMASTAHKFICR
jgi:hypothetical protein